MDNAFGIKGVLPSSLLAMPEETTPRILLSYRWPIVTGAVLFVSLCGWLAFLTCPVKSVAPLAETRNVLILHSYHKGFSWTDSQARGIDEVLGRSGMRMRSYTEYVDRERNFGAHWFEELRRPYARKYAAARFDVIICTDDNAYRFMRYQQELFPDYPVVFCEVNSYDPTDLSRLRPAKAMATHAKSAGSVSQVMPGCCSVAFWRTACFCRCPGP